MIAASLPASGLLDALSCAQPALRPKPHATAPPPDQLPAASATERDAEPAVSYSSSA